jgi:hypothetical protein
MCVLYAALSNKTLAASTIPDMSYTSLMPPIPGFPNPLDPICDTDPECPDCSDCTCDTPPSTPPQACDPFQGLYGKNVTIALECDVVLSGTFMNVCSGFVILQDRLAGRHNVINISKICYIELLAQGN